MAEGSNRRTFGDCADAWMQNLRKRAEAEEEESWQDMEKALGNSIFTKDSFQTLEGLRFEDQAVPAIYELVYKHVAQKVYSEALASRDEEGYFIFPTLGFTQSLRQKITTGAGQIYPLDWCLILLCGTQDEHAAFGGLFSRGDTDWGTAVRKHIVLPVSHSRARAAKTNTRAYANAHACV